MVAPSTHPSTPTNKSSRVRSARVGGFSVGSSEVPESFFEAGAKQPESSSPARVNFSDAETVGERAKIIHGATPKCRRIVAITEAGEWLCLSCAEPHNLKWVFGMGAYSSERYYSGMKPKRDARLKRGICESCNEPVSVLNKRLCERHRIMKCESKARARERRNHAITETLYPDAIAGWADGARTFANGSHEPRDL